MREARLIVPLAVPAAVAGRVETLLLDAFGGFTAVDGRGAWRSPAGVDHIEPVRVYTVAVEDRHVDRIMLRAIAERVLYDGHQESVYLRHADGAVEFVEPMRPAAVPAANLEDAEVAGHA